MLNDIMVVCFSIAAAFGCIVLVKSLCLDYAIKSSELFMISCLSLACTAVAYVQFGLSLKGLFYELFWQVLLITAFIDLYTSTIVDGILYILMAINALLLLWMQWSMMDAVYGAIVGFCVYLLIYYGAKAYYKAEAFGFGDVILMGAIGMHLGLNQSLLASILAFYIALIAILLMRAFGHDVNGKLKIPFGPYMCLSGFVVSLYGKQLIALYVNYFLI